MKIASVLLEVFSEGEGTSNPDSGGLSEYEEANLGASIALRTDLLERLRAGPIKEASDPEVAEDLIDIITDELTAYATGENNKFSDEDIQLAIRALKAVLRRLEIECDLEFRNLTTFKSDYRAKGLETWEKRRVYIESVFKDQRNKVEELQDEALVHKLDITEITSKVHDWEKVVEELKELKRSYEKAATVQEIRAIGTNCIGILEEVGDMVYNPETMKLNPDNNKPFPKDRFKERIDSYIAIRIPENENEVLRRVARSTNDVAQRLKHKKTNRTFMEIAVDASLQLVIILKRLDSPDAFQDAVDEEPF